MTPCLCLALTTQTSIRQPVRMHTAWASEHDLASSSPAFHDTRIASLLPVDIESDFMPDELRWVGPPPAMWGLLAMTMATLAPLFLALVLAAGLP